MTESIDLKAEHQHNVQRDLSRFNCPPILVGYTSDLEDAYQARNENPWYRAVW